LSGPAAALLTLITAAVAGCAAPATAPVPSYDETTRLLVRLSADLDGDGRADQWTYLTGSRPLRSEIDADGDGRIERWEYFGPAGALTVVGTSSRDDGTEDTWSWAASASGERRVDLSRTGDRTIDRREFYRGDTLERVEEDTNGDGRADRWEHYDAGRLREVTLDTSRRHGRPDRRLIYDERGQFVAVEEDPDRTGQFRRRGPGDREEGGER
jgi:hypothetical protein